MTVMKHLVHLLEEEERFPRTSHPHKYLQRKIVQIVPTRKNNILLHILLVVKENLL